MPRLHPIPYGLGVLLIPDFCDPVRDERVVKPTRRKGYRRDRV
jgi:hypothetical protein